MNQRIKDLKENIQNLNDAGVRKTYLYEYVAKSLKMTDGEPTQIRRAKAFAYVLEQVKQEVLPYEKITGTMFGMCPVYEKELMRMQEIVDNSSDNREISAANKRKEKLQKQLKETKEYDAKAAHLALSRIDIDLDDGVKVNYEKVQTASDGTKLQILAKI